MRKFVFWFFLMLGIVDGYLKARNEDWGLCIVMMAIGALFGGGIGYGLSKIGQQPPTARRTLTEQEIETVPGDDGSGGDLAANYWRDKGHPPFTRMPDAEPDKHMFDPDRIG